MCAFWGGTRIGMYPCTHMETNRRHWSITLSCPLQTGLSLNLDVTISQLGWLTSKPQQCACLCQHQPILRSMLQMHQPHHVF